MDLGKSYFSSPSLITGRGNFGAIGTLLGMSSSGNHSVVPLNMEGGIVLYEHDWYGWPRSRPKVNNTTIPKYAIELKNMQSARCWEYYCHAEFLPFYYCPGSYVIFGYSGHGTSWIKFEAN